MTSKSEDQLNGNYLSTTELESDCDPVTTVGDLGGTRNRNVKGVVINDSWPAIPCGLIARSFFNDNYTLYAPALNKTLHINQQGIAWEDDRLNRFKNIQNPPANKTWRDIQWLDMEDEHFMVWMRTAGLPNFRKLWGKI
jgi:hypothetical protein